VIDRDIYFDNVRAGLFGGALSQQQVDGQNVILALWDYQATGSPMTDLRWLAYMLATVYHECATKMWPVTEGGSQSYLQSKEYWPYIGRGFVQLTWEANYDKASAALGLIDDRDLVDFPQLALDSLISARILFRGMSEGWFTGRKLGEYFNDSKDDPVNARQIINGNDCDDQIAGYHDQFLTALTQASTNITPRPTSVPVMVELIASATAPVELHIVANENAEVIVGGRA